jgi:hypothetical protein
MKNNTSLANIAIGIFLLSLGGGYLFHNATLYSFINTSY